MNVRTFEDKIINEPHKKPYYEPFNDPFVDYIYNLDSACLAYTFKVIFAAVLGIVVLLVVLPALLSWSSKPPINNTDEAQRQRPHTVTLNIGNSLNNYIAPRQAPSDRYRLNQTTSETSYTENVGNHLVNLRGMLNYSNNMYIVRED